MAKLLFLFFAHVFVITALANGKASPLPELTWKFSQADSVYWLPASVPGCVHTDLLHNGKILNLLQGANELLCQWVGTKDWIYETEPFSINEKILHFKILRLRFAGLDTYADIYLNGTLLLKTDNAFRSWEVDVLGKLQANGNVLRILFHSSVSVGKLKLSQLGYPLPYEPTRAVSRKPQYHFGWDWGPKLVTCGITRPVDLIACENARYTHVFIRQNEVTEENASLTAVFEIESANDIKCDMTFFYDESSHWNMPVRLKEGMNRIELAFDIPWPKRWWCNDWGDPYLYAFTTALSLKGDTIESRRFKTGLRSLALVAEKDSIGTSFYFSLNDFPVFAKGANYIPMSLYPAANTPDDYRKLLEKCRDAHFNMIRVWGGGWYEDDEFYQLCDELGIMVWQDFMFACDMYPGNPEFLKNVRNEAQEQTRRLRNHPCIALWCGNNEVSEGWQHWGWQTRLNQKEKNILEKAYDEIFKRILPKVVEKNTHTSYWESSPLYGRNDTRSLTNGDCHYWGVWHDAEGFEVLEKKIPRFMSEFGVQSYPSPEVLYAIADSTSLHRKNHGYRQHQKFPRGFQLMDQYIKKWYPLKGQISEEKYGELTQIVQAEGMAIGIEAQRRSAPKCMGTLYWQLNDVWPAFSWSSIDYAGNEKLFFSLLKEIYAPQLISATSAGDGLMIYWINDNLLPEENAVLHLMIYSADDVMVKEIHDVPVFLKQGSHVIFSEKNTFLFNGNSPENHYMKVELRDTMGKIKYERTMKCTPRSSQFLVPKKTSEGWSVGKFRVD